MEIKIYKQKEQDKEFYSIMGKYFASRKIAKEFGGYQLYNTDNSIWYLLYDDNKLIGFCSSIINENYILLDNFYILNVFRNKGYSKYLLNEWIEYNKVFKKDLKVMVSNEYQKRNMNRFDFKEYKKSKNYIYYIKEIK